MAEDTALPITMIIEFAGVTDADGFSTAYGGLHDYLAGKEGFTGSRLLRSARTPDKFLSVVRWADTAAYQNAVRSGEFLLHHTELADVSTVSSDQFVAVAGDQQRVGAAELGAGAVALTSFGLRPGADAAEFETALVTHAEFMAQQDGFRGFSFLRSVRNEGRYVNVGLWQDPPAYRAVMATPAFREEAASMARLAVADGDLGLPVAVESAAV
jgi:heme-degrading monooxygenase HmoA